MSDEKKKPEDEMTEGKGEQTQQTEQPAPEKPPEEKPTEAAESEGKAEEAEKSGYLLMSDCIAQGLYHPNCKDSHTTYFGDILDEEEEENDLEQTEVTPNDEIAFTPEEQKLSEQLYEAEQRENYCERQAEKFERLSKYSLDKNNQRIYKARKSEWKEKIAQSKDTIEEIKQKIVLDEEKRVLRKSRNTAKKPSVVSAMIGEENISDVVQRLSFDMENSEENEEKTVANSAESGIIEVGKPKECYIHPDKVNKFLLLPGAKHSKDFFDVGYAADDHDLLVSDITKEYDYGKAVEKRHKGNTEQFSIFMYLGKTVKKRFRVVWQKDTPDSVPRMITAHRED